MNIFKNYLPEVYPKKIDHTSPPFGFLRISYADTLDCNAYSFEYGFTGFLF